MRRTVRLLVTLVVLGGLAAGVALVVARQDDAAPPTTAPSVLKTVAVTSGTLSTTERIDGTVESDSTLEVRQRIEGQTASNASSSSPSARASSPQGFAAAAIVTCPTGSTTSVLGSTTTSLPTTTEPTTTVPETTTTEELETTTTDDTTTIGDTTTTVSGGPTSSVPGGSCGGGGGGGGGGGSGGSGGGGFSRGGGTTQSSGRTGAGGSSSNGTAATRITKTITSVIADGAAVGLGDVLYTVDSQPVVMLLGPLPAWRTLSIDSDPGPDVTELELSLVALGYDPTGAVTVDQDFDAATEVMVESWQRGLGLEATGVVDLGSVVFVPTPTTVTSVTGGVGDKLGEGDLVLALAAATQHVVIDVPSGDEAALTPGLAVKLAGDQTGTVSLLRSTDRDGSVVVQALIVPDGTISSSDGTPVTVTVDIDDLAGVLIVPSQALLSKVDGSYTVQVQSASGAVEWHTVDVLGVSGAKAGIKGDGIVSGTLVLVPA